MRYWARITRNDMVAPGVRLLGLEAPEPAAAARPGQFVMLRVDPEDDPLLARPFSVYGVEGEELLVLYRMVGRGTRRLARLKPDGERLVMWGPLGRPFDLDLERPLLVAGGMGLAPLVFAARRLRNSGREVKGLCGAATKRELAGGQFLDLDGYLIDSVIWRVSTDDGTFGRRGPVTLRLEELLEKEPPEGVLACGPLAMLKAVAGLCQSRRVPCQVSLEAPMACGVGACQGCALPAAGGGYLRVCREGPVLPAQRLDWSRM